MTSEDRSFRSAIRAATLTAAAMIAYQVAGKATRDAFFLSTFDVTTLPAAVFGSALVSIAAVLIASRGLRRFGPARLVPVVFLTSAGLLLAEWVIAFRFRPVAAAAVYLHFNALGALLISGFWSLVSERFDPRTAKQQVGRIGAAGTLGGLAGGVLAERMAVSFPLTAMLPVLAGIHVLAAGAIRGLAAGVPAALAGESGTTGPAREFGGSGARMLVGVPYLRNLVALVLLAAVTEGALDYVFKARAAGAFGGGPDLMRLFAGFYTGVAVLTFVVQAGLGRRALEALGLARTVATLPASVGIGASGMLIAPGLASAAIARGVEAVLHNSLYRSGYELLFTPLPRADKRAVKPMVDVGCTRLGDALGAGLVQAALWLGPATALPLLSGCALITAVSSVLVALHLHRGYLRALEQSLLARAVQLDLADVTDNTTRSVLLTTMGGLPGVEPPAVTPARPPRAVPAIDPTVRRVAELRSGDPTRVRAALEGPLDRQTVAHVIPLLAWDEVAPEAIRALRSVGAIAVGQLVDALLDPVEEFAVRRRIPAVLSGSNSDRAVMGLLAGLEDPRFEVRYRSGRALARLEAATGSIPEERVFAAVLREVNVGTSVWESQRLLDRVEDDEASPFVDEFLRDRASRSLEHVFTLLSLVLPRQPLTLAFRGLHTDDRLLRGTALEYLESVLPPMVRERLWPFLEDRRPKERPARPRDEILADLIRSNVSIALNLEELRKKVRSEK